MDIELISMNVAGWNWRVSNENWGDRLKRICKYIIKYIENKKINPLVIALQEVQASRLTILNDYFSDFYIVLPQAFKNQPRSIVAVLLINKHLCESYNTSTLKGLENNLRYNFVQINTLLKGFCFQILNAHIPQNCFDSSKPEWVREERKAQKELFIENIKELANVYRSKANLIVLGDLNSVPNDSFIDALAYTDGSPMIDKQNKNTATWGDKRLDYILYSRGMLSNTGVSIKSTMIDNTTISEKLSDHTILIGGISLDFS